ncbi:hypothetical protein RM531_08140 [Salinisphaera sp. P385]|uniref:Uncharacterized protein n=1 Tax=Spectribacter acetivorans TaxID=3075603 RepID=A0ABU3B7L2_9GAMM|nr:hypothetical protein [Salinisphaera sp. P385]MDT0618444.1 hypothetical protein [Salinisphaera sp. P385]
MTYKDEPFQARVAPWMQACFGEMVAGDAEERNYRFLEEAIELVQSCGATSESCHQLVDYVFGRPVGEPHQEVGGVQITLAALCLAQGLDMDAAGEDELARVWRKIPQIQAKQATKPLSSPLPGRDPDE